MLSLIIAGTASKSRSYWRDNGRHSDKFIVKRRESIRHGVDVSPFFVDRTATDGDNHVFFVARNRRVVDIGNSRVIFFHSVTRCVQRR